MTRIQKPLWWLNIFLAFATLLSYLAPLINPQEVWQASFMGLAYPTLLWGNIFFLGLWLVTKRKWAWLPFITILLGWTSLRSLVAMGGGDNPKQELSEIQVLSYNTNFFGKIMRGYSKSERKENLLALKEFLQDQKANLICIQEFPDDEFYGTRDSTFFPGYSRAITPTGSIFSKWEILDHQAAFFQKSGNGYVWADIKTDQDTIRVFNVHLQSNSISQQTNDLEVSDLPEQKTWATIKNILAKVNSRTLKRVDQAEQLKAMMQASPHPILLTGDLNNTAQSYIYRLLSKGLVDSFRESGWGVGSTYAGKIPGLRIDFIFSDPNSFNVISSEVLEVDHSDHYPLLSVFQIRP
ncbi:MAG: endonuclease/exonuclease/phosphatase family protein [Saprospiraceae bacterium]|nr:endonuclease/exonuclease/phosphatase family protein [Saprospiraceae bacterium]